MVDLLNEASKDWSTECGVISIKLFTNICKLVEAKYHITKEVQIRTQFNEFDRKHKGFITSDDFIEVC